MERRAISDRPVVPEWIAEASLAVSPPRHLMVLHIGARRGAMCDRLVDQAIGILDEELYARAGEARAVWA